VPLTAIVLTLNSERDVGDCLAQLGFADEILVVDSGSRDRTRDLAAAAGARVLERPLDRFDAQRNWAQEQAAHPWVLFVDSDERVPKELGREVRAVVDADGEPAHAAFAIPRRNYFLGRLIRHDGEPAHAAFAIPRRNYFLGRLIRHCGWGRDRVTRLLRRDAVRWEGPVHEKPRVRGTVGRLGTALEHHPYPTLAAYWDKLELYARMKANQDHERGRRAGPIRILLHQKIVFTQMYVLRGGWLEGVHGLVLCLMSAFSSFTRAVRLWEMGLEDRGLTESPRAEPVEAPHEGGPPVSVLIPTFNEADNIDAALDSALWADDVLVVDSFSTDDTLDRVRRRGVRTLEHEYVNSATQKNWALPQTRHTWAMVLDADERFTPELAREVRRVLAAGPPAAGYVVRRVNHFLGRRIRHCGWNNDRVLRLFDRTRARYQDLEVHAEVDVDGTVDTLRHPLLHYTYLSVDQYWPKFRRYTDWGASQAYSDGQRANLYHLLGHPLHRFVKMYLVRLGILDGTHGLVISLLSYFSVFAKYAKLWEMGLKGQAPGAEKVPGGSPP